MFYHQNLALEGLFPGVSSFESIANKGHLEREVIIEPVVGNGGGGYVPVPKGQKPERYRVTVRVTINGKRYEETQIVDDNQARVLAQLSGITLFSDTETMVSVNGIQVFENTEPSIKVTINKH
jgi:hypothetical protein